MQIEIILVALSFIACFIVGFVSGFNYMNKKIRNIFAQTGKIVYEENPVQDFIIEQIYSTTELNQPMFSDFMCTNIAQQIGVSIMDYSAMDFSFIQEPSRSSSMPDQIRIVAKCKVVMPPKK